MRLPITIIALSFVCAGCPSTGAGMIHRDAIRPTVNAVTAEFDELVTGAVQRGEMKAVTGDAWLGESALLRHLVLKDSGAAVAIPPLLGTE
jgi:hypothetical protein|tara:strand:+ start:667 stop:939 length:273 start_codon:yes stop_codon:yes gene_type:complete